VATTLPRQGRGVERVTVDLHDTPHPASAARLQLRSALERWRLDAETVDSAVLMVSELVGNAVRHTGGEVQVRALVAEAAGAATASTPTGTAATLRVEVLDASQRPPIMRRTGADAEGGRGLVLVERLAERWGYDPGPLQRGKVVWFELCATQEPAPVMGGTRRAGPSRR